MPKAQNSIRYLILIASILLNDGCELENQSRTTIEGSVGSMEGQKKVHTAFLFLGDRLLATSREDGSFEIDSLEAGSHSLLCSSLGFRDTLVQIDVREGAITACDIFLKEDFSRGRLYGELHDQSLYDAHLSRNPSMAGWNGKELFDGVSGATIQTMTFGYDLPSGEISIGDSLIALTDGFGQYWVDVQSGTYPLRISMPGWEEHIQVIMVEPNSDIFANFILPQH